MADLFTQPCTDVLVIGVGALGCAVAGRGALNDACEMPLQAEWSALHTQSSELFATGLERRLLMALPAGVLREDIVDGALDARTENWTPWVQGKRIVMVVADEDDALSFTLAARLSARIQGEGAEALLILCAGMAHAEASAGVAALRIGMDVTDLNLRPSALAAARVARTLEAVEALVSAWRAPGGASPWLKEPLSDFLRWGRLDSACGCARDAGELARNLDAPPANAEGAFLLIHGASERSVSELARVRDALCVHGIGEDRVSIQSVEGRGAEEGLFWLLLSRRARPGNIVALDAARKTNAATSAACART